LGARAFGSGDATSKVADIKLPGADISLVTLISQLRALLRIQTLWTRHLQLSGRMGAQRDPLQQKHHNEALDPLKRAESARTCGPRSNAIRDLITTIEAELAKSEPARTAPSIAKAATHTAVDDTPASKHEVKPLPEPAPACPGWKKLEGEELSPWPTRRKSLSLLKAAY
jgi:hypothetical protein